MGNVLLWLLVIEILGLVAFPLTFVLFKGLPDRGVTLTKVLALLLTSYLLWILGLTNLIPNSRYTIIGILVIIALVSAVLMRRQGREMISFLRRERAHILVGEALFLGIFLMWVTLVAQVPAINGTEKPMDFGFFNAILRSEHFPPEDMWLAGHSISYYYFGHLEMASLTKLTGIASNITYNLSIALIPALVASAAYGLAYNLVRMSGAGKAKALLFALAAPVFIGLIGNLVGVLDFVQARGLGSEGFWQWMSIKDLSRSTAQNASFFPQDYLWWWHSTRVIDTVVDGNSLDFTITEFPFFSFLLGDLHAHMLSLPFLIFSLSLAFNLLVSTGAVGLAWLWRNPWESVVIALSLGALAFINIWDLPVFAAFLVGIIFVRALRKGDGALPGVLLSTFKLGAPLLAAAVLLFLPFYLGFSSQASGILPLREVSTRPLFFILIWGLFLLVGVALLIRQLWTVPRPTKRDEGVLGLVVVLTFLPIVLWGVIVFSLTLFDGGFADALLTVSSRFGKLLPLLIIVGLSLYSAIARARQSYYPLAFSLLLMALAFYLLMGAELFYLKDFLPLRMNTVFKLYYQAWLLLAIASAFGLYWWLSRPLPRRLLLKVGNYGWAGAVAILLVASFYYPAGAALDRVESSSNSATLDGLAFLKGSNPAEYEAIRKLRDEAPWGGIVEAVGGSYSDYGRIAASTGLPSPLNWPNHELQWRGSSRLFAGREADVKLIYESDDLDEVQALLDAYQIRYVYVGPRERKEYGPQGLAKFPQFMKVFFQSGNVVIYERMEDEKGKVSAWKDGRGS